MADFIYAYGHLKCLDGTIDLSSADIRIILVDTTTTADTEKDATAISDFTTLGEFDGSGAPSSFAGRIALGNETLAHLTASDRVKFGNGGTGLTVSSVSAGTNANQGIVVYYHDTNDAGSIPLAYLDASWQGNGGDITLTEHADGLFYFTHP